MRFREVDATGFRAAARARRYCLTFKYPERFRACRGATVSPDQQRRSEAARLLAREVTSGVAEDGRHSGDVRTAPEAARP